MYCESLFTPRAGLRVDSAAVARFIQERLSHSYAIRTHEVVDGLTGSPRPLQPPPPAQQPVTQTRSPPRNIRPTRNIDLPPISPIPSLDEPATIFRSGNSRSAGTNTQSRSPSFRIIEQSFSRGPSALFAGPGAWNNSPTEQIETARFSAITKLQDCLEQITQENPDEKRRQFRERLIELQYLLGEDGAHLCGPNAAQSYSRMQVLNRALRKLFDRMHEIQTEADVETFDNDILPSFQYFALASKTWLCWG